MELRSHCHMVLPRAPGHPRSTNGAGKVPVDAGREMAASSSTVGTRRTPSTEHVSMFRAEVEGFTARLTSVYASALSPGNLRSAPLVQAIVGITLPSTCCTTLPYTLEASRYL